MFYFEDNSFYDDSSLLDPVLSLGSIQNNQRAYDEQRNNTNEEVIL